jgi:hypothetical protein
MDISGLSSLFRTQETEETERVQRIRKERDTEEQSTLFSSRKTDSVTISAEGRRMLEAMQENNAREQGKDQQGGQNDSASMQKGMTPGGSLSAPEDTEQAKGTGKSGGSGAAGGSGAGETADSIDEKIAKLEAKIQTVAKSEMPEASKQAAITSYQAQIAELVQQKNELMAAAAKKE